MNEPPFMEPALAMTLAAAGVASLGVAFRLFVRHIDGRPLLPHEPRRSVPWNFLAPLVLLGPSLGVLVSTVLGAQAPAATPREAALAANFVAGAAASSPVAGFGGWAGLAAGLDAIGKAADAEQFPARVWMTAGFSVALALGSFALLAVAFGATRRDLGLPASWRQLRGDAAIGATAFAASLAPIYLMMMALDQIFKPEHGHPYIEQFMFQPSLSLMAGIATAAVIVAPLFEETAFRLVLQGWLERGEARPLSDGDNALVVPVRGWVPIVVSSVLFGLAHFGQGVAPAPLIFLGVILGYVYHRTHRIVPCMVCHMLFNAFSLLLVWLQFGPGG